MSPKSWVRKLFAPKAAGTIRRPAAAAPRLGLEQFDERLVPTRVSAVSSVALVGQTLTITASEYTGADVTVSYAGGTVIQVADRGSVLRRYDWSKPSESFVDVKFVGGPHNDRFANNVWNAATISGGAGNDTLTGGWGSDQLYGMQGHDVLSDGPGGSDFLDGGSGNDTVYASSGGDILSGGAGNDVLDTTQAADDGNDFLNGGDGDDDMWGGVGNDTFAGSQGNDRYWGEEGNDLLDRYGQRGYFLDATGSDATTGLVTGTLSHGELTAPGARLFARLSPADATKLEVYGPSGAGFTLQAAGWQASTYKTWFGTVAGTQYKATGSLVQLDTGRGYSIPLPAAAFSAVRVETSVAAGAGPVASGLSLDLTTALGGSLASLQQRTGMSLTLPALGGGIQLGANLGHLDLPVAPAVPYLYAALSPSVGVAVGDLSPSIPLPTSGWGVSVAVDPTDLGALVKLKAGGYEVGFGWSQNGEIPYTPALLPDDRTDPGIAGNLYVYASGQLPGLPVSLTGDLVVDLDANDDGSFAGLTPQAIGSLAKGRAGLSTLAGVVNDLKIGANGRVDASLPISKSLDLSLPVGEGSLYWTPAAAGRPGEVAFRAASADPFRGTPFDGWFAGMGFDVQGRFDTNLDFRLAATSTATDVDVDVAGVSVASAHQSFGVEFKKAGGVVSLGADYHLSASLGDTRYLGATAAVNGYLTFGVNVYTGAVTVSGSGTVAATGGFFGATGTLSASVSFDNHGVYVDMPIDALDFEVAW